jgi:hypothetical protein
MGRRCVHRVRNATRRLASRSAGNRGERARRAAKVRARRRIREHLRHPRLGENRDGRVGVGARCQRDRARGDDRVHSARGLRPLLPSVGLRRCDRLAAIPRRGLRAVEGAKAPDSLARALRALFSGVAPSARVFVTANGAPALASAPPSDTMSRGVAWWSHRGVGLGSAAYPPDGAVQQHTTHRAPERKRPPARCAASRLVAPCQPGRRRVGAGAGDGTLGTDAAADCAVRDISLRASAKCHAGRATVESIGHATMSARRRSPKSGPG